MRIFEEHISKRRIVEKILKNLSSKFDHIITVIEKSKDLSIYIQNKLIRALLKNE